MTYSYWTKIDCDAYVNGEPCYAWQEVPARAIADARRQLPVGWTHVRHPTRGPLDLCPLCAINLGKISSKALASLQDYDPNGVLRDAAVRASWPHTLEEPTP